MNDCTRIVHLSDLHFNRVAEAVLEAVLTKIGEATPDLVIVSGDFTQNATRSEFRSARAFLDRIESPTLCVPGNHDIPSYNLFRRFLFPLSRYKRHITPDLYPTYTDTNVSVIGLNTARRYGWYWDWSRGRISPVQWLRVRHFLAQCPEDTVKIVVTHHPFIPPPTQTGRRMVGRAERAVRDFAQSGVDLILAGHLHKAYRGDISQHYPDSGKSMLVIQSATSTSTRLKQEPNSFNLIDCHRNQVAITCQSWYEGNFSEEQVHTYRYRDSVWTLEQEQSRG